MNARAVPFFCPYCGEENLRPAGSEAGDWECLAADAPQVATA